MESNQIVPPPPVIVIKKYRPLPPLPIRRQSSHGIVQFVPIDDILAYKLININSSTPHSTTNSSSNLITLPISPPKLINLSESKQFQIQSTNNKFILNPLTVPLPLSPPLSPTTLTGVLLSSPNSVGFGQGNYTTTSPNLNTNRKLSIRRAAIPSTVIEMSENSFLTSTSNSHSHSQSHSNSSQDLRRGEQEQIGLGFEREGSGGTRNEDRLGEIKLTRSQTQSTRNQSLSLDYGINLNETLSKGGSSPVVVPVPVPLPRNSPAMPINNYNKLQDDFTLTFPSTSNSNSNSASPTINSNSNKSLHTSSPSVQQGPLSRSISNQLPPPHPPQTSSTPISTNSTTTPSTPYKPLHAPSAPNSNSSTHSSPSKPISNEKSTQPQSQSQQALSTSQSHSIRTPTYPHPTPSSSSRKHSPKLPSAKVKNSTSSSMSMYWSKTPVGGRIPKGMRAHTSSLVEGNIWSFGGCDERGKCNSEVWKLDCETFNWTKPKVIGTIPPPTRAHTSTVVNSRLFIIGGGDGPHYFNSTYYFDTISLTWFKPPIFGTPPSRRRAHTTIYYKTKNKNQLIVFGGGNGNTALNDVFSLEINDLNRLTWTELQIKGKKPVARGYHTMDLVGSKCVVFGGSDGGECFGDVWVLDLEKLTWTEIKPNSIPNSINSSSSNYPRLSHTSTLIGSYLFIIGGHNGLNFTSDIIVFNLVNCQFESRTPHGLPPSPRGYHTTLINDSRIFLLGGFNGQNVFEETFSLDLGGVGFLGQITNFVFEVPGSGDEDEGEGGKAY